MTGQFFPPLDGIYILEVTSGLRCTLAGLNEIDFYGSQNADWYPVGILYMRNLQQCAMNYSLFENKDQVPLILITGYLDTQEETGIYLCSRINKFGLFPSLVHPPLIFIFCIFSWDRCITDIRKLSNNFPVFYLV